MTIHLPRGPVMVDLEGDVLTPAERLRLLHPQVGAVILFRRNFSSVEQLRALTAQIHTLRSPHLLIAVDHEGGRVQRFLSGFTRLSPMQVLGELWQHASEHACRAAESVGYVLAAELRASGIDLSFTPVLDLDYGRCAVIGNRAFAGDSAVVSALACALARGLVRGGMVACGKHFPGHGWVEGDSHHVIPEDNRDYAALERDDLQPFVALINAGMAAVMPAHVIYHAIDPNPAGFSPFWLQTVLRQRLGFDGTIFSDDLCMEGAAGVGDIVARATAAFDAGCDMALVCNRPDLADTLLAAWQRAVPSSLATLLARMAGQGEVSAWQDTIASAEFAAEQARVTSLLPAAPRFSVGPAVGEAS